MFKRSTDQISMFTLKLLLLFPIFGKAKNEKTKTKQKNGTDSMV